MPPHPHDTLPERGTRLWARRQFLRAAAATGLALAGAEPLTALATGPHSWASAPRPMAACGESVQEIVNTALVAEQLATTFYYTGLTAPEILRDPRVAGSSGDPNAVAPDGMRSTWRSCRRRWIRSRSTRAC